MRVCAEFEDHYTALAAHRHLVDEGLNPQEIEVRSPYPLPEHPIPPHRSAPMAMRTVVRCMWAVAVLCGFTFVTYTQYEWAPVTVTNGHPLIPIPITMIVTYECGMITAILTTTLMFFLETFRHRELVPALEEDMPVAIGYVALVVGGRSADRAMKLLEGKGARSVVSYAFLVAMLSLLTGCSDIFPGQHNMRKQDVIKATEAPAVFAPAHSVRMPNSAEQVVPAPAGIGLPVTGDQKLYDTYRAALAANQFDKSANEELKKQFGESQALMDAQGSMPKMYALKNNIKDVDAALASWSNPVKPTPEALERGKQLYLVNCASCHGNDGKGDGKVGELCAPAPPAIGTKYNNSSKPDGYFYFRVYSGQGQMPPFGYKLNPEEISSIVLHLRQLQGKS